MSKRYRTDIFVGVLATVAVAQGPYFAPHTRNFVPLFERVSEILKNNFKSPFEISRAKLHFVYLSPPEPHVDFVPLPVVDHVVGVPAWGGTEWRVVLVPRHVPPKGISVLQAVSQM